MTIKKFQGKTKEEAIALAKEEMGASVVIMNVKEVRQKGNAQYDREVMYWAGYLYRYWHILTNEPSREIYAQAPAKTMNTNYLMFHTMAPELTISKIASARPIPGETSTEPVITCISALTPLFFEVSGKNAGIRSGNLLTLKPLRTLFLYRQHKPHYDRAPT